MLRPVATMLETAHARAAAARVRPVPAGACLLALLYAIGYLADPASPGNDPAHPLGWWGWWDQGRYLASARALAAGDWAPDRHWFPLGYAVLAAPFARLLPAHPFFFVNLASLLACYGGFVAFARRVDVPPAWAVPAFLLAVCGDPQLFRTWFEPWSTSPTAALLWLLLAGVAAHVAASSLRRLRLGAIGATAASIAAIRPTEALDAALCLAALALHDALGRRLGWRDVLAVATGGLLVAAPYAALHLGIYGLHATDYVRGSEKLGFAFGQLGFKAFVLLVEPRPWFGAGQGLLQRAPWMVLGLAGLVPALLTRRPAARWAWALLAAVVLAHTALYVAYVDLLPTGLWRYGNVHYFKPLIPGLALLAVLWLRRMLSGPRRAASVALAGVLALLCLRLVPQPAVPGGPARLAVFAGAAGADPYFSESATLRDAQGDLPNITSMRLIQLPAGLGAVALRREFAGPIGWAAGTAPPGLADDAAPALFAEHFSIGWPCVLPPYPCRHLP